MEWVSDFWGLNDYWVVVKSGLLWRVFFLNLLLEPGTGQAMKWESYFRSLGWEWGLKWLVVEVLSWNQEWESDWGSLLRAGRLVRYEIGTAYLRLVRYWDKMTK